MYIFLTYANCIVLTFWHGEKTSFLLTLLSLGRVVYVLLIRFVAFRLAAVPQSPSSTGSSGSSRRGSESGRGGRGSGSTTTAHPAAATTAATVPLAATAAAGRSGRWTGGRSVGPGRNTCRGSGGRGHVCAAWHGSDNALPNQPTGTLRYRR